MSIGSELLDSDHADRSASVDPWVREEPDDEEDDDEEDGDDDEKDDDGNSDGYSE